MKKIFIAVFFLLRVGAYTSADTGMKYIDAKVDGNKLNEANADLAQIEIDFCNKPGQKAIIYTLASKGRQDICLKARNMSTKDIQATIEFVDGTVTNDQRQNKACMQQGENQKFGKYVTGFTASFTIPANSTITHHATFTLPKGTTGTIN
ncbi:MAG TPA: hypothetical protein PKC87_06160, partial [Candidatus Absconditabacterales bacterium]|nr:hypothetical protein [Candidatus Absconditabacterales bacterium]